MLTFLTGPGNFLIGSLLTQFTLVCFYILWSMSKKSECLLQCTYSHCYPYLYFLWSSEYIYHSFQTESAIIMPSLDRQTYHNSNMHQSIYSIL